MTAQDTRLDPWTGLLNRSAFDVQFKEVLEQVINENAPLSFAFLDIDEFKRINDTYGHKAGDYVLQAIANVIKANLPSQAFGIRYGGDEFALLFPNTEREQAFLILESIRATVNGISSYGEGEYQVNEQLSVSAGIAAYPIDGNSENELFRNADQAMYRAKVAGRNCIRLAYEEKMAPKTAHFTLTQLERLSKLAKEQGVGEAVLLREALDDLLLKYWVNQIESQ
ncbi:MAG TPA: diguanylate cyclase [Anaerolineales bacterium]|nr:diguanylate cyclase [Anaerolineales bacterium]